MHLSGNSGGTAVWNKQIMENHRYVERSGERQGGSGEGPFGRAQWDVSSLLAGLLLGKGKFFLLLGVSSKRLPGWCLSDSV